MTTTTEKLTDSTPVSMIPALVKDAQSSDKMLDYSAIVKEVSANKDSTSFSFTKGNGLFNAVCQYVKSKKGIRRTDRLADEIATSIRNACDAFVTAQLSQVNLDNAVGTSKRITLRGNRVVERVTVTGINPLDLKSQDFQARLRLNDLAAKREKAELEYRDTTAIDNTIAKWMDAQKLARYDLAQIKSGVEK